MSHRKPTAREGLMEARNQRRGTLTGDVRKTLFVSSIFRSDNSTWIVARVDYDPAQGRLWVVTDDYEGSCMMGIEMLAPLRLALALIAKAMKEDLDALEKKETACP